MRWGYRLGIIEKEIKPKIERGNCSIMVLCVHVCVCMWVHLGLEPDRGGEIRNAHYCRELYYY